MSWIGRFAATMGGTLYPGTFSSNGVYVVYVHVTFMNDLWWLTYFLPMAVCDYYGLSYFMVKKERE